MKSLCAYHNVLTSCRKLHAFDVSKLSCDLKKYALFCTQYVYFKIYFKIFQAKLNILFHVMSYEFCIQVHVYTPSV